MAEPPTTSEAFLNKYESDVVKGTWKATGIFTGIAYGAGLFVRPIAPKTAGVIASGGSATHLPPPEAFKGPAFPRAGIVTLFNAVPAPGWITPPEVLGIKPGFIVEPGDVGENTGELLELAGLQPTPTRVDQYNAVEADKLSLYYHRIVPGLSTPTLIAWHGDINSPDFQQNNPKARASELSVIVYGELLKRKVYTVPGATDFERGLRRHALPVFPPYLPPGGIPAPPPATGSPPAAGSPPAPGPVPGPGSAPHPPGGIFGPLAASARSAPESFDPVNGKAIANVARATGIRKQLATEREDP